LVRPGCRPGSAGLQQRPSALHVPPGLREYQERSRPV